MLEFQENIIQHPENIYQHPENIIQHPENIIQHPENIIQHDVSDEEFITRQVKSCKTIFNRLTLTNGKESKYILYDKIMTAMEEQDTFICDYTMNLMALCETHMRLIRSIKFRLNKQKMETSLRLLTANVIKTIPEMPIDVEKDMAAMFELSLVN
jgi:hypothetical protein